MFRFRFIEARNVSDIVDPSTTLGIEITDKDVAACCGLGNLDGQHGTFRFAHLAHHFERTPLGAAIELALDEPCCLVCWRLDFGVGAHAEGCTDVAFRDSMSRKPVTLATTRPDVDSVGAMAALVLRALEIDIDAAFVEAVAKSDSFRAGAWSPKPLPTEENPWPSGTTTVDSTQSLAAFGMICSPRPHDRTRSLTLAQRVYLMAIRLATIGALVEFGKTAPYVEEYFRLGDSSRGEIRLAETLGIHPLIEGQTVVKYIGGVHNEVQKARQALARAAHELGALEVVLSSTDGGMSPRLDVVHVGQFASEHLAGWPGRTAFAEVRVAHAGALSLGYCVAPVVVAFDQSTAKWFVEEFRGELGWKAPFGVSPASDEKYRKPCDSYSDAERLSYEFSEELQSIGSPTPKTRVVSRSGKVTIAAYTDGHLDTAGLTAELNRLEAEAGGSPKWGGPQNMVCSPSHVGTRLTEEAISEAVSRFVVRR